jgi:hypothetical protein
MMTAIMNELIDDIRSPLVEADTGKPTATAKENRRGGASRGVPPRRFTL